MNLYQRRTGGSDGDHDLLTAMVEEAIAETLVQRTPEQPHRQPDPVEPVGAEGFLTDAAAFLKSRPDATDLLRRLQILVNPSAVDEPPPVPAVDAETTSSAAADSPPPQGG